MPLGAAPLDDVADRLAAILAGPSGVVADGDDGDLIIDGDLTPRLLTPAATPASEVWAIDGGQALVRDARCLQVYVVRAGRCCFVDRVATVEDEGELRAHLVGTGQRGIELARVDGGLHLPANTAVDINLLRERVEWDGIERTLGEASPGALVLVDGDLRPDPRLPLAWVTELLADATDRGITVVGVTKHTSLSRGGAPLIGQLEREADVSLGARSRWWAPIGHSDARSQVPFTVVAARLDPDAAYSFRLDIAIGVDPEVAIAQVACVSDDAAFPGYPYPLTVADRLAACPPWLREEAWMTLEEQLRMAGIPGDVLHRAFDDRHRSMERAS
ncbi:MAG: DNA double-strand break repair nuclease NurA [Actinobacteria bacterium]|nr:DNA double-strand break repair nuclease NurA [Actinomycetota bacterium]